jgi:2',3'-cyclic-nucleotide 2'-phosphodiesterase (5'-nucleotidase family)
MPKRKQRIDPELRAQLDESYERTVRMLEERIAYHRATLDEERARKRAS